jgi:predicted adenine nucleotide alpha hydrolase (AANH) superfamily ATPase
MDTELRATSRFKLQRADVAQRLMQTLPVIKHLDEFKHGGLSFVSGVERMVMEPETGKRCQCAFKILVQHQLR